MKTELEPEARDFARVVDDAVTRAGGVDLLRRAEAGEYLPTRDLLDGLGVFDLRPRDSAFDAEVAAAVCRVAGRHGLPYPVAERLAGRAEAGVDLVAVSTTETPRIAFAAVESDLAWWVSDGDARRAPVTAVGDPLGTKLGALTSPVEVGDWQSDADLAPLALTLPCWTLLGMIERAFENARRHVLDREQFGRPLAAFQAIQFRIADGATAVQGLTELAKYTVWSVGTGRPDALVDAVAFRFAALETAEEVFRTSHQLFGAMGFCDETDLSWLSRYSQPLRRLPWGRSQTQARLLECIDAVSFAGLFAPDAAGEAFSAAS